MKTQVVVAGESAGGVVAALRAAREGLETVLVSYGSHLGGVFPSLGAVEAHYHGSRSPLLEELKGRILDYYRQTYGEDSEQYRVSSGSGFLKH